MDEFWRGTTQPVKEQEAFRSETVTLTENIRFFGAI